MNVKSTLKKIFNSYDFRGNRIKNLRVDTPDESIQYRESDKYTPNPDEGYFGKNGQDGPGGVQHFVANKLYVDKKTTYNTEKVWRFKNPFNFDWIKNIQGKPYKEIFDDLFFPLQQHEFISPEVTDVNIFAINRPLIDTLEVDNNFKKFVVYRNCSNNFTVKVKQNRNEWSSGIAAQLIVTTLNGTRTFNSTTTDNDESIFEIEFFWDEIISVVFKRVFDIYEERLDSYGNISVPPEPTYTLEKDITKYFNKVCYPFTFQYYINGEWLYTDKISIDAKTPKIINFSINNMKNYCLKAYIFNNTDLINIVLIKPGDFKISEDYKSYDFGYYPFNITIQIVPQAIKLLTY